MPVEGLRPDIAFAPAQELNGHLVAQKEDAERLVGMRSADIAQLQCELAAAQQSMRSMGNGQSTHSRPQAVDWQMSIAEAVTHHYRVNPSDADLKALQEDKRQLQVFRLGSIPMTDHIKAWWELAHCAHPIIRNSRQ